MRRRFCRNRTPKPFGVAVGRWTMQSDYNKVPLHAVELRDRGKKSPAFEAEAIEQFQTRLVVSEDQPDQSCYSQRRRAGDCFFQQSLSDAVPPEVFMNINANLGCAAIRAAWQEFLEIEPADHAAVGFHYPEWMLVRRMFAEPRQTRFNRGRLKLGRHHARRHSGVVDVDDDWEIGFERVADRESSCSGGLQPPIV